MVPGAEWTSGQWNIFAKVEEVISINGRAMRSKHMTIEACGNHWFALRANWIEVAMEELVLDAAWNRYIDRTER